MSEAEDASAKGGNLTAVEAISAKLAEVTRLAEKLDARLCEAGARTRPVPISTSVLCTPLFTGTTARSAAATPSSTSPTPSAPMMSMATSVAPAVSSTSALAAESLFTTASTSATASTALTSGVVSSTSGPIASNLCASPISSSTFTLDSPAEIGSKDTAPAFEESAAVSSETQVRPVPPEEAAKRKLCANGKSYQKVRDEAGAEDANADGYVTATECSTTPTARSRSESFVTTPDSEEAAPVQVTSPCSCSPWWNMEDQAPVTCTTITEANESKIVKVEAGETSKVEVTDANGISPIEKCVSHKEIIEEKSGKIVKEVTETTTLRVSHDTRLGIASYKVTSNTMHNHQQHYDINESENIECTVPMNSQKKVNGIQHEPERSTSFKKTIEDYKDESLKKLETHDQDSFSKFAKLHETVQEERTQTISRDFKDMSLSLKEVSRHHEDSGIEMSPTKKEERGEGDDFLEQARKVSSTNDTAENGERISTNGYDCVCDDEYSAISVHAKFIETTAASLANEGRRRVPLSNPS